MDTTIIQTINKFTGNELRTGEDILTIEEPLEIRISFVNNFERIEKNLSVTMRTPGDDEELAIGFLFTEGIIESPEQITSLDTPGKNIIIVTLRDDVNFEMQKLERHFYTSSSCGVCGKTSIDAIKTIRNYSQTESSLTLNAHHIYRLPSILRQHQNMFDQTGGIHASAIFDADSELILLKEDVGRHNALDKLIGAALQKKLLPLSNYLLLLSGRASFELIQKATMAGINIVAAVGAPSSLAVELARERSITLIGFLRNERFNVYCGEERILMEDSRIEN